MEYMKKNKLFQNSDFNMKQAGEFHRDWVFIEFYNIVNIQVDDSSKQGANYE